MAHKVKEKVVFEILDSKGVSCGYLDTITEAEREAFKLDEIERKELTELDRLNKKYNQ